MNKNELKNLITSNVPLNQRVSGGGLQTALKAMGENLFCSCGEKEEVARGNFGTNPTDGLLWQLFEDGEFRVTLADSNATGFGTWNSYINSFSCPWNSHRSSITSIVIEHGVRNVGQYAFRDCVNLTSVAIPNSVTSLGERAFGWCPNLTSIIIPDSVTSISHTVFKATGLISVTIPNSVTFIGQFAFEDCRSLTSVIFGSSVSSIGNQGFYGCSSLMDITSLRTTPPSLGGIALGTTVNVPNNVPREAILRVPASAITAYRNTGVDSWGRFYNIVAI